MYCISRPKPNFLYIFLTEKYRSRFYKFLVVSLLIIDSSFLFQRNAQGKFSGALDLLGLKTVPTNTEVYLHSLKLRGKSRC